MNQQNPPKGEASGSNELLDKQFAQALCYAWELHCHQRRKLAEVPFFAHLMSVAGLVLDYGGNQQEAIAALLHDAAEDQGGLERLEEIRQRFGDQVAAIVKGCTDSFQQPKPPWRERKEQFLCRLAEASDSVRLVCAADKIHNLRSLIRAYRAHGETIWSAFRGGREGTLWYYRTVLEVLQKGRPLPILQELADLWDQLHRLVAQENHR
ncbi:MAG: HD domain-containing protein [Thermoguttaceae bacterium]|nr:HD domain-containing protein [Thermoguttaceae bacterium]MDW8038202.1 HD domain-containing protein [Thermoguttaceae bacterium]